MAKALFGHLPAPSVGTATLARENALLRQRVADLTALIDRLKAENDALREASSRESLVGV